MSEETKKWGDEEFWGIGFDYDPQWLLTPAQKDLQARIIELSRTTLRDNAVESDRKLIFPRKNFEALASLGLLGLLVSKDLGGMGENHTCAAMVVETIARYGCASTAMCYCMHLGATAAIMFRAHGNPTLQAVLKRVDADVFIGTLSYSDPETGSHIWYPLSSKAERVADGWKISKKASWTTSGGFADWYIVQTTSPDFDGDYTDLSCFLVYADEIVAEPSKWDGMGMRGNQSGALVVDNVTVPAERMVGPVGDGVLSNDEAVDPFFLICSAACWNGISMGLMDIAKRHATRKTHADVGMRVADYPTIQDYFGEAMMDTAASRAMCFQMARALDDVTDNCDWSIHEDPEKLVRSGLMHWLWMVKFTAAKNVTKVGDDMLHACGGSGYKPDLGIERYLRDGKAGWLMGPTNEILRQFIGKAILLGFESLDFWNQSVNERAMYNEIRKLDKDGKRALAEKLLAEARE